MGRRSIALKLAAGVAATFAFACSQADALQFDLKTKADKTCTVTAIGSTSSYGVSIPACDIPIKRVYATGYLFRDPDSGTTGGGFSIDLPQLGPLPPSISVPLPIDIDTIQGGGGNLAGATRFPSSTTLPYEYTVPTQKIGTALRLEVTLQLRGGKRASRQWRQHAAGPNCHVKQTRTARDTISCDATQPIVPG